MEDFDIFTNEINLTKPVYKNTLNNLVYDIPGTPNGQNYQRGRKQLAVDSLADNDEIEGTFHLSEAVSASIRIMADYREEQRSIAGNKLQNIIKFIKPVQEIVDSNPKSKQDKGLISVLDDVSEALRDFQVYVDVPLHKKYLRFTKENNVDNFRKILNELPKEWTVIQLTAPYNPNDNFTLITDYRMDISSIFLSVFTNDYLDDIGPFTINIPANVTKGEERPLFTELYSILEANYNTINNAQFLNNKRLVQNYWSRREDIDLRMKSLINVMDKEWLGLWGGLLTGKLIDTKLKDKVVKLVDDAISDWGFIKLTKKQKVLFYNLIESSPNMTAHQIKSCTRRILTEHGNIGEIRQVLVPCDNCNKEFKFTNELCLKCLSKCFEKIHNLSLVDGIKAFSEVATLVKDGVDWAALKKAKRHPVILIVDEILDTFPWENLPILNQHPVTRIENIHFLYYLYKLHEKDIVNGYFHTKGHDGRYVINPEKNLERMQHRMSSFVKYWCSEWSGTVGEAPKADDFLQYLATSDIFLYCGHGDGCHFANGSTSGVEESNSRAICILSGCSSARLQHVSRGRHSAAHRHLHIAGSPTVVGMLWEVTDLEVDKMVTTLVSLCVTSQVPVPWQAVGKANWSQGELDPSVRQSGPSVRESSVPCAASRARAATSYTMIASCLVVRGLPAWLT